MNIISSSSSFAISFFSEKILPSLTAQQKKILVIATIALGFLTACYAIRHVFYGKVEANPEKKEVDKKVEEVVAEEIEKEEEVEAEEESHPEIFDSEEEIPLEAFTSKRASPLEEVKVETAEPALEE